MYLQEERPGAVVRAILAPAEEVAVVRE